MVLHSIKLFIHKNEPFPQNDVSLKTVFQKCPANMDELRQIITKENLSINEQCSKVSKNWFNAFMFAFKILANIFNIYCKV